MLVNRFRAFGTPLAGKQPDDSVRPEMRRQLQAFIRRPVHRSEASLGEAYTTLFWLLRDDSTVPGAELARVVEGMRRHQQGAAFIVTSAPIVLADRGVALDLAESLAREIPRRDSADLAFFKRSDPEQYSLALKQSRTHLHDALGWIALRRGRRVTARAELGQALAILPQDTSALLHMGLLEEKAGNLAAAEALFARGYTAERAARNHPHEQALRRVYLARHGSLAGYEALVAKLSEQERAERRARILAERLKQPRALPPFRLAHLDGTVVASDSLRGKVVFLNFWGAWCGPCVLEAPLIQTLHERYRAAPDVAFLTIDMGDDTTRIREFMAQRKLDFPVLIDDRYVMTSGVRGFPTDWFVGPDGRIAFETNGGTDAESMVEEFAWRIEVLRAEKATAPPAARGAR